MTERMELDTLIPHIGPRCAFCGAVPEEPHSRRCGTVTAGFEHQYVEWPDDIKAERDALRRALNRLATEGCSDG